MVVILFGNEKGGSGKTTISVHVAVHLATEGHKVASLDMDSRQQSFTRYIDNRIRYGQNNQIALPTPNHYHYPEEQLGNADYAYELINKLAQTHDILVIDTPGSTNISSCAAHALADIIITPVNDSFVDLDLIGQVKDNDLNNITPGIYSSMLWEQRLRHAKMKGGSIDWLVIRNRLANVEARNKHRVEKALGMLSKKFGFRVCSGFSERVIFRELFTYGLTLLDINRNNTRTTVSHIAAKQELRNLIAALKLKVIA